MALTQLPYDRLEPLLRQFLMKKETAEAAELIKDLRHAKIRGYLKPAELERVCRWKSPRAIRQVERNSSALVRSATRAALATRSERLRLQNLMQLKGVSVPMASAILMLLDPKRYGVIDIRVWQLLYEVGTVRKNSNGVGFDFNNWYQYLMIIRYFAKKFGVHARDIERTLFEVHRAHQAGNLYD
jgi:hypothetical protein